MKRFALSLAGLVAAAGFALLATPSAAQAPPGGVDGGPGSSPQEVLGNPSHAGLVAITPSRIPSSSREMNRGRRAPFQVRMSPREARRHARDLVGRAEIRCDVAEAMIVAYTDDNIPLLEVDCVEGGGLVISDTVPIQATDCLDLAPPEDQSPRDGFILTCQLSGNVATVTAARQSARN